MIKELEKEFTGTGEVQGIKYKQFASNECGFLYEVFMDDELVYYEVFLKKLTPICINFEERIYSETDFKEVYPKSKDFGVWAWTVLSFVTAVKRFNALKN